MQHPKTRFSPSPRRRPFRWALRTSLAASLAAAAVGLAAQVMAEPVDINSAGPKELAKAMRGVGMSLAKRIVAYRKENGPFQTIEDLVRVRGIGKRTVQRNAEKIHVVPAQEGESP